MRVVQQASDVTAAPPQSLSPRAPPPTRPPAPPAPLTAQAQSLARTRPLRSSSRPKNPRRKTGRCLGARAAEAPAITLASTWVEGGWRHPRTAYQSSLPRGREQCGGQRSGPFNTPACAARALTGSASAQQPRPPAPCPAFPVHRCAGSSRRRVVAAIGEGRTPQARLG